MYLKFLTHFFEFKKVGSHIYLKRFPKWMHHRLEYSSPVTLTITCSSISLLAIILLSLFGVFQRAFHISLDTRAVTANSYSPREHP